MNEPRVIEFARATASKCLCQTPCFVYSICGIGLANTDNTYTIYNGQNAEGKLKMILVAGAYQADFRLYAVPLYFSKGFYVEFTTSGEELTVQLLELAEPKD